MFQIGNLKTIQNDPTVDARTHAGTARTLKQAKQIQAQLNEKSALRTFLTAIIRSASSFTSTIASAVRRSVSIFSFELVKFCRNILSGCDWRIPEWISATEKSGQSIDYAQLIRNMRGWQPMLLIHAACPKNGAKVPRPPFGARFTSAPF